jgi:hypothetical protein
MKRDNQPTSLRSLGLRALIGGGGLAILVFVAGRDSKTVIAPAAPNLPLMPRTNNAVILAVESQRSARLTTLAAVIDTNAVTLTIREAAPVSIAAAPTVIKRGSLSLAWNRSPDASAIGYRLYYGTNTGSYYASATVGNVTNATLTGLDEGTRYFVVATARDAFGGESDYSNEADSVTPIFISLSPQCWQVSAYGMVGKTNLVKVSTNLTTWQAIGQFVGDGALHSFFHTNVVQASFRVEVKL